MNLADHVARVAHEHPRHPAIRFEEATLDYATLDACASTLAAAPGRHGIHHGDRVALFLPNIPAFAPAYLATLRAGAIAVSISPSFEVRAAMVLEAGQSTTPEALERFCHDQLAHYEAPARIDIVAELPTSAAGKILKRVPREQARA